MQHLPFAHFHPGCSLLLISTPNSRVNKTCWQHARACDIKRGCIIKTWFKFGSPGSSIRVRRGYATSVGCLGALVSTKRSPTPAEGSEWKVEKCNWYALMRPYSLSLVFCSSLNKMETWARCIRAVSVLLCCVTLNLHAGMRRVGSNSCYIRWWQCDSKFRLLQAMRLTQRCLPQPQWKLCFLKPAHRLTWWQIWLFDATDKDGTSRSHVRFHELTMVRLREEGGKRVLCSGNKDVQKSTHIFSNKVSTIPAGGRGTEKSVG